MTPEMANSLTIIVSAELDCVFKFVLGMGKNVIIRALAYKTWVSTLSFAIILDIHLFGHGY